MRVPDNGLSVALIPTNSSPKRIPASLNVLAKCEPIYEEFEGWMTDISGIRKYEELPENARKYLERLSEVAGVELGIVSVGPNREQTIVLKELF